MTLIKKPERLSLKLVSATLFYSLLIATFITAVQLYISYQEEKKETVKLLGIVTPSFTQELGQSLWDVDLKRTNAILDSLSNMQNFGYLLLKDEENTLFERNQKKKGNAFHSTEINLSQEEDGKKVFVGTLYIELSKKDILGQLKNEISSIVTTTISTLLLGSLLVLVLFQRWVSKHLEKMADFTMDLDLQQLDKRLQLDRAAHSKQDELASVAEAINRMLERMQHDLELRERIEKELLSHKINLEEKILERTQEIYTKNAMLENQREILEGQNRELDAYAHSVAHDLKTPLTSLIGIAGLLNSNSDKLKPEQIQQSLISVLKISRKMASIIDSLLTLASVRKVENIPLIQLDVRALATEACSRLEEFARKEEATIEFMGEWPTAFGHEQWIEEVWVNFISNAIKYGGKPPRIEIGSATVDNTFNKYWVRDHGPGIPPHRQGELFIQFSRLDPQASEGHGLGLSIVKRIINKLGGEVGYETAKDGGGIFWFTLPTAVNRLQS